MRARINPIRLRLLVVIVSIVSLVVIGFFYLQFRTVQLAFKEARTARERAAAQVLRLYVELSYPGAWSADGEVLLRGGKPLPSGEALAAELDEYIPPDMKVLFVAGAAPGEHRSQSSILAARLQGVPPPPAGGPAGGQDSATAAERGPASFDIPFVLEDGAGVALRGEDGQVVGWIHLIAARDFFRADSSGTTSLVIGVLALVLVLVAALGALVFWLSRPIDTLAEAHERERERSERLASISCTDPLTGLLNRRGLEASMREGKAAGAPPSHVALLDLDHFKAINDERGHDTGDTVLVGLARLLEANVRHGDICARWGGEEFVVLLHDLPDERAAQSAERIRASVESHPFGGDGLRVTATSGIARIEAGFDGALKAADEALYRGKREGRNRVVKA